MPVGEGVAGVEAGGVVVPLGEGVVAVAVWVGVVGDGLVVEDGGGEVVEVVVEVSAPLQAASSMTMINKSEDSLSHLDIKRPPVRNKNVC